MSNQNPGIYFDACNSWNGYNHQGKIALYVTIKSIVDNWDESISAEANLKNQENNFLEIEYIEDFAIGKIEQDITKYISIHQVKDRQDAAISSYDSALLGLGQHFIDYPDIESAYLHSTIQLNVVGEQLTDHVKALCKAPKYLTDLKKYIEEKRDSADFRSSLIENKRGRPNDLKRRLKEAFHKNGINAAISITEENLDDALDKLVASIDAEIAAVNGIPDEKIKKISIYNYPLKDGQDFCGVESAPELLNDILKKYYEKTNPGSYKVTDEEFLDKAYLFILDKLDQHIIERDLKYLAYKDNNKDRKIYFNTIISWLNSDEINSLGRNYLLYIIKEKIYSYKNIYCNTCSRRPCVETCSVGDFEEYLRTLGFDEFNKFLQCTNPNVAKELSIMSLSDYLSKEGYYNPFLKGLRDIGIDFSPENFAISYKSDNKQAILTTLKIDGTDNFIQSICTNILNNMDVFSLLMETDCLISKDIEVESIKSVAINPIGIFNPLDKNNITKIKNVKIETLDKYMQNLQQGEEE